MHTPVSDTTAADGGLGGAAKQVAEHASTIARLEVELAKLELQRKVAVLGVGIGLLAGAGLFAFFMLGFGLAAVAAGLATFLPVWAAILIVAGFLAVLSVVLALAGRSAIRKATPPVPEQAIQEAKLTTSAIKR
jgi:Putative Actinobacterial Holin-X, holin superfamily III